MKASELIRKLQNAIDAEGDGSVCVCVDFHARELRTYGIEITKVVPWRPTDRNYAIVIEARSGRDAAA